MTNLDCAGDCPSGSRPPARSDSLPVTWRGSPFSGAPQTIVLAEGLTVAEIVARVPDLPSWFDRHGVVCIDGEPVPRRMWPYVRPRVTRGVEVHVTLHVEMHGGGGGGGGKQIAQIVGLVAVAVVASALTGGAAAGILGPAFGAGTIGATLLGVGAGLSGTLLLHALAPPPTLDTPGFRAGSGSQQAGQASLRGNVLRAGAAVPRVIGTHRIFPPFIVPPLAEIVGDDEYIEAVFGLAGPHSLTDIRVGPTPIGDIDEIDYEVTDGLGEDVTLVTRQSRTEQISLELSSYKIQRDAGSILEDQAIPTNSIPQPHVISMRAACDEFWIPLYFNRGMFDADNPGMVISTPFRIRMRRRGGGSWFNLPEIHFTEKVQGLFRKMLVIKWETAPSPTVSASVGAWLAYKEVPAQSSPASASWSADAHFSSGAGGDVMRPTDAGNLQNIRLEDDRAIIYLPAADKDVYDIEIKQGCGYNVNNFTIPTYGYPTTMRDWFWYRQPSSNWVSPDSVYARYWQASIPRVAHIWNEKPLSRPGDFTAIAIRVHNRQVESLSCLASGLVRDYASSEWGNLIATSNPAPHYRDVLAGILNADRLPPDLMDDDTLVEWRQHCIDESLTVNAVVEGRSAFDVATMIAAAGNARPRQSEVWGVAIDRDRSADSPIQVFSPRNSRGFRWERGFVDRPDALRVRFSDSSRDYEETEIIVLDPDGGVGLQIEDIRYDGLVTESAARARALFDLKQSRLRSVFYSLEADAESILCQRGDLVAVQHDAIDRVAGFARIRQVVRSGSNVTALVLDGSILNDSGGFYTEGADGSSEFYVDSGGAFYVDGAEMGLAIRRSDGTVSTHEITAVGTDVTEITFASPVSDPDGTIVAGAHVTAGRLGREYRRLIVTDIRPGRDAAATLTLVDEAPELWS